MKKQLTFTITILCLLFLVSCGENKSESTEQKDSVTKKDTVARQDAVPATTNTNAAATTSAPDEGTIRKFLHSKEGTYGWQTQADKIMLDFFEDGRLAIQGPDGEATMWEGTWKLKGDQLTMKREDLKKTITVTTKIEGDKLVLGDKTYTRYKP